MNAYPYMRASPLHQIVYYLKWLKKKKKKILLVPAVRGVIWIPKKSISALVCDYSQIIEVSDKQWTAEFFCANSKEF